MAAKKSQALKPASGTARAASTEKRTYFKQADFPQTSLQQAQKIASALIDNFAGRCCRNGSSGWVLTCGYAQT